MSTKIHIALTTVLVLAAALAGCTAGNEGQAGNGPAPTFRQVPQDDGSFGATPDNESRGNQGWKGDLRLDVDPKDGPAPLNVTISYDVGGKDRAPGSNSTGNSTGTTTGNSMGNSTGDIAADASDEGNLTWTLVMWRMQPDEFGTTSNATDGPPGSGNATGASGKGTGNSTTASGNTTGSTGSATGAPSGNATGNSTGNSTDDGSADDATSAGEFPSGLGNLTLTVNGTRADLPGVTVQRVEAPGHYQVRFTVDYGNGTVANRTAVVHARTFQEGEALGNETQEFEGSFLASEPLTCLFGSEEFVWTLNHTFGGHGATVAALNVTLAADGAFDDYELTLVAPNGTELASGPSLDVAGPLGAGNYTLRVDSCTAVDTAFVVTAVAHYAFTRTPSMAPTEADA